MPSSPNENESHADELLLCRVGRRFLAVPVRHVDETMRPMAIEPLAGAPAFVSGLAVIRGVPTPVVDGGALLGAPGEARPGRLVVLRVDTRRVALAVDAVSGLRSLAEASLHEVPPLLSEANADAVQAIGTLDAALLLVLRAARVLPEATEAVAERGDP